MQKKIKKFQITHAKQMGITNNKPQKKETEFNFLQHKLFLFILDQNRTYCTE